MAQQREMITLQTDLLRVSIDPAVGAGIADFSIKGPGRSFFPIMRRAAPGETNASLFGSFLMAPWVNRVRAARFVFAGRERILRANTADGMAQHGDVRKRPWTIREQTPASAAMDFDSRAFADSNWPWAYTCLCVYALTAWPRGGTLSIDLSVTNADREPFPAGCGHHPYFMRRLWDESDELHIRAPVVGRYPLENGCATGPAAPDDLTRRLAELRPLPDHPLDDVFAGFGGEAELRWPASAVTLRITASPEMSHLVLYAPHASTSRASPLPYIAVEPQTQVNGALNLLAQSANYTGTAILAPGQTLHTRCTFQVDAP